MTPAPALRVVLVEATCVAVVVGVVVAVVVAVAVVVGVGRRDAATC